MSKRTYYPDRGLTRVESSYRYTGALEGSSTMVYLITYKAGDAAPVPALAAVGAADTVLATDDASPTHTLRVFSDLLAGMAEPRPDSGPGWCAA